MNFSDNLNGTFTNPLICGDYPDPDIIRVGGDFYMVSSTFTCAPGIPVCHSRDLVNWKIIGHAYARLPESNPAYALRDGLAAYRGGSWAPFIRHRDGKFFIGFNTPAEGFFMCIADRAEGPYEIVPFGAEFYDPSLLFDDDGRVWLVHGANGISVTELNADARGVKAGPYDIFQTPFGTPTEGSHFYKRGHWYYLCLTSRGYNGIQTVLRSRNVLGPYEWRILSADDMNYASAGLHQGGFLELECGESFFFVFQDRDYLGRVPVLQPMRWVDEWPVLGDPDNFGKAVVTTKKPSLPQCEPSIPEASDDFDAPELALRWHWNHNPDDARWSLTKRPGWLRLEAGYAPDVLHARNTLMQKIIGPETSATTRIDVSALRHGDVAGLAVMNIPYAFIAVVRDAAGDKVTMVDNGHEVGSAPFSGNEIHLRTDVKADGTAHFSYGALPQALQPLGEPFVMQFTVKTFLGNRFGLFCYNSLTESGGHADFDFLRMPAPKPANLFSAFEKIPAVAYDDERGTDTQRPTEKRPVQYVININHGDWIRFDQVDFGNGASHFEVMASPVGNGGRIEVRHGSQDGELLGTCEIPGDGNMYEWTGAFARHSCPVKSLSGIHALCLRFVGPGRFLFRLESFQFQGPPQ